MVVSLMNEQLDDQLILSIKRDAEGEIVIAVAHLVYGRPEGIKTRLSGHIHRLSEYLSRDERAEELLQDLLEHLAFKAELDYERIDLEDSNRVVLLFQDPHWLD